MVKIYHNPRCRKSRETLAIVESKGNDLEIIEYLKHPPSKEELTSIVQMLGVAPKDLIRKGEEVYKLNFKGKELSDQEWIDAMVSHPVLIERPIVIAGNKAIIGRPPENVMKIL